MTLTLDRIRNRRALEVQFKVERDLQDDTEQILQPGTGTQQENEG
jgi:hypothetical protein